ncbi:hypothetical protein Smp_167300 [Schistosoma mansoni]|uniref:hypothetical protein n=1 Tax=Schistosoma mansoni TaxID=6183 RepID=UPI00022C8772|nr:hypothetical protein Smp_167300 [Schistosoma mansoni]|eukprot:XP_018645885.1 hypothetical protein Smp_167300 [Schistosoma mansoni]
MSANIEKIFLNVMTSRPLYQWADFEKALFYAQEITRITYVKSDFEKMHTDKGTRYKYVNYKCSYSTGPSNSPNINNTNGVNEGCTAAFQVRWVDNCYVVTFVNQEHNHSPSSNNRVKKAPENKRQHIDASNKKTNPGNNESFSHPIVLSSIRDQIAQSSETLDQVLSIINRNSYVGIERNSSDQVTQITLARYEQVDVYRQYPEVVLLNAAYDVNSKGFSLFQFIVTDGFGCPRPIMYSVSTVQQKEELQILLNHFCGIVGSVDNTHTFIMDCAIVQLDVVQKVFPKARILLNPFIIKESFTRKCDSLTAVAFFHAMITTVSPLQFDYYLERLKNTSTNAYNYVVSTWIPIKKMWAASSCLDAITLGTSIIEIIKGVNFSLKESLRNLTSVKEIMTIIYNEAGKKWVYPSSSIISSSSSSSSSSLSFPGHSTNNLNNNNNLSEKFKYILEKLTDYAAEMVCKRLTKVDNVNIDFTNEYLALCTDSSFVYEVDRNNATCNCSFNISSFLPCEHLLKVFMVHGLHKDLLYRSKRWLQCNNENLSKPPIGVIVQSTNQSIACLDYKNTVTDTIEKLKKFQTQQSEQVVLKVVRQITNLLESVLPNSSL